MSTSWESSLGCQLHEDRDYNMDPVYHSPVARSQQSCSLVNLTDTYCMSTYATYSVYRMNKSPPTLVPKEPTVWWKRVEPHWSLTGWVSLPIRRKEVGGEQSFPSFLWSVEKNMHLVLGDGPRVKAWE